MTLRVTFLMWSFQQTVGWAEEIIEGGEHFLMMAKIGNSDLKSGSYLSVCNSLPHTKQSCRSTSLRHPSILARNVFSKSSSTFFRDHLYSFPGLPRYRLSAVTPTLKVSASDIILKSSYTNPTPMSFSVGPVEVQGLHYKS